MVTINTFLNNGTLLSGDLPQSSYVDSDVESTSLSIKIVDIKNNTTKTELETITFNGITSRIGYKFGQTIYRFKQRW